jgi:hypothetical protein
MPERPLVMNKAEVIRIMTDAVESESLRSAKEHNVPDDVAIATIEAIRDNTDRLHGVIYDALKEHGVL